MEEPTIKEHLEIIETLISILKKIKLDFASISLLYNWNNIGQEDRDLLSPDIPSLPKAVIKMQIPYKAIDIKNNGIMAVIF